MENGLLLGKTVNLRGLKSRLNTKFPASEITNILSIEPDEMSIEAFLSKAGTWLAILDATHNNLNIQKGSEMEL